MSSDIEYRRVALQFDAELGCRTIRQQQNGTSWWPGSAKREVFLVFAEAGSSNLTMEKYVNGKFVTVLARNWVLGVTGAQYKVIERVARDSVECEGGMLKMSGRRVTPEGYIKAYRRALKESVTGTRAIHAMVGQRLRFNATEDDVCKNPWLAKALREDRLVTKGPPSEHVFPYEFTFTATSGASMTLSGEQNLTAAITADVLSMIDIQSRVGFRWFSNVRSFGPEIDRLWDLPTNKRKAATAHAA